MQRLRQIAIATANFDPLVAGLCEIFATQVVHRDPGVAIFGLRNALLPIGDCFLEVVSPIQPNTTVGRLLEKQGDPAGYMVIFQTDDLAAVRARVAGERVRIAWEIAFENTATIHLHPKDMGVVVSYDQMATWDAWLWAGAGHVPCNDAGNAVLTGVTLAANDPEATNARWRTLAAQARGASDAFSIGEKVIRFVPAGPQGERLEGLTFAATDRAALLRRAQAAGWQPQGDALRLGALQITLKPL